MRRTQSRSGVTRCSSPSRSLRPSSARSTIALTRSHQRDAWAREHVTDEGRAAGRLELTPGHAYRVDLPPQSFLHRRQPLGQEPPVWPPDDEQIDVARWATFVARI